MMMRVKAVTRLLHSRKGDWSFKCENLNDIAVGRKVSNALHQASMYKIFLYLNLCEIRVKS